MNLKDWRHTNRPIEIRTNRYGNFFLRVVITVDDLIFFTELTQRKLTPREFTIRVIHHQLESPRLTLKKVRALPDEQLIRIARAWIGHKQTLTQSLPVDIPPFMGFKQSITDFANEQSNQLAEAFQGISESMAETLQVTLQPLVENFAEQFRDAIQPALQSLNASIAESFNEISRSFPMNIQLPDLTEFNQSLAESLTKLRELKKQVDQSLEERGYGFTVDIWTLPSFFKLAHVTPRARGAAITNKLLRLTQSTLFETKLTQLIQGSPLLRHRWKVVNNALKVHRERNYLLSVPALLTQVEGILQQILLLDGYAFRRGRKLYLKGPDGKPKLNKHGNRIQVHGLKQLTEQLEPEDDQILKRVADMIANHLTYKRNEVMHGNAFGTAKLSTQSLMLIFVLANIFSALEAGNKSESPNPLVV